MSTLDLTLEPEPVGRRRWPEEIKTRIVAEAFALGAVVSDVARRHGLTPQQVFTWRRGWRVAGRAMPRVPCRPPGTLAAVAGGLEPWLRAKLALPSQKTSLAEAIRYALTRWTGLSLFLEDGRVEIDNNTVERAIRPLALSRKNALFAGSDGGAEHWAVVASLIETCKLTSVEPHDYLADVITRIVNGHPQSRIDELLPWAYSAEPASSGVA